MINAVLLFCTGLLKGDSKTSIVTRVFMQLKKEVVHSLIEFSPIVPGIKDLKVYFVHYAVKFLMIEGSFTIFSKDMLLNIIRTVFFYNECVQYNLIKTLKRNGNP